MAWNARVQMLVLVLKLLVHKRGRVGGKTVGNGRFSRHVGGWSCSCSVFGVYSVCSIPSSGGGIIIVMKNIPSSSDADGCADVSQRVRGRRSSNPGWEGVCIHVVIAVMNQLCRLGGSVRGQREDGRR